MGENGKSRCSTHEEVIGIGIGTSDAEEFHEIVKLAVDITAHGHGTFLEWSAIRRPMSPSNSRRGGDSVWKSKMPHTTGCTFDSSCNTSRAYKEQRRRLEPNHPRNNQRENTPDHTVVAHPPPRVVCKSSSSRSIRPGSGSTPSRWSGRDGGVQATVPYRSPYYYPL